MIMIFDLDGTLLDTLEDLMDSLNHVLKTHSMPERTLDEVRRFVGNGIHKLIERAVPAGTGGETIELVYRDFLDWYQKHCAVKTRPYDGVSAMVQALKDAEWKLAVVSNKADAAVKFLCETFFPGTFDVALGDRAGVRKKPAPDGVYEALRLLGVESRAGEADRVDQADQADRIFYMGDSDVDIETAQNAGISCISVTWGFRSEEFLLEHGATCLVRRPEETLDVINS